VPPQLRRAHRGGLAATGLALAVLGVLGFSMTGFSGVTTFQTQTLVVLPVTPFVNLTLLLVGWWVVQRAAAPLRGSPVRQQPSSPSAG